MSEINNNQNKMMNNLNEAYFNQYQNNILLPYSPYITINNNMNNNPISFLNVNPNNSINYSMPINSNNYNRSNINIPLINNFIC